MSPSLAEIDRQEVYGPRWLVEVADAGYFSPYKFSSEDLPTAANGFYHGCLLNDPEVSASFVDTFWGVTEVTEVVVRLRNLDNALDGIYTGDPRGQVLVLRRYDTYTGVVEVSFTGKITDCIMGVGAVEITATAPDLRVFEQEIPKGVVSVAAFTSTAADVGDPIDLVVGVVQRKRLPYVKDDTSSNIYEYLVGYGVLTVSALYRDGPDKTLHLVNASEYSVVTGVYGGCTVVRFTTRQLNFQNGFHSLYADITGLSAERNFVRAIRTLLSNATYGLGESVNAASFDAAEAQLDPVNGTAVTGLYCDGVFRPRQAQDILRDLLMVRGMRLSMNASGEWTILVDTEQSSEKLHIRDGSGDGERTLLEASKRRRRPSSDMVADVVLRFGFNDVERTDNPGLEVRQTVNATGRDLPAKHPYISNTTTADKVAYYLAMREKYGSETVEAVVGQEGRKLQPGDLVRLTYAPLGFSAQTMEVRSVQKVLDRIILLLGTWSTAFYGYSPASLPSDPAFSVAAPAAPTGVTGTGVTGGVILQWTPGTGADVTEVWRASTNDRAAAEKVGEVRGALFFDSGLAAATTYYYWLRSRAWPSDLSYSAYHAATNAGLAVTVAGKTGYKLTLVQQVFSGTFVNDLAHTALVFDALSKEVDWLVRQGGDLHWGETSPNASVITALGSKFVGETKVAGCFDGADFQVGIISAAWEIKYARLDPAGSVEQSPTALFTPSGTNRYVRVAVAAQGSSLHWAILQDEYSGAAFTQSSVCYARTSLTGTVQVSPTMLSGTESPEPSGDIRIVTDTSGHSHIFWTGQDTETFQDDTFQADVFATADSPSYMRYIKVDDAGIILIAASSPFSPPPGAEALEPAGVFIADDDVHVIGYIETGVGLMLCYGRMSSAASVEVPMTLFYATPTDVVWCGVAYDSILNQAYISWASTSAVWQLRLDPVDPTGEALDATLPKASL